MDSKKKEQKNRVEPGSQDKTPTLAADDEDLVPWNSRKPRTVRVDQSCRILAAALHCMQAEEYSYMRAFFLFSTQAIDFFHQSQSMRNKITLFYVAGRSTIK